MRFFKIFDLYGDNVSLLYQGNKNIKTSFGGLICFISGILLVLLIIGFGQDFFKRINPSVIRESQIPTDYPTFIINNNNFSLALRLEDDSGNELLNSTSIYLTTFLNQYKKNSDGIWETVHKGSLNMKRCTKEMFFSEEVFENNYLNDFWCPEFNNTLIGGSWSSDYVGYFYFEVNVCTEGKTNLDNEPCANQALTDNMIDVDLVYFSHYIQSSLVSPSNYTNGVGYNLQNEYFMLSKEIHKTFYYYFSLTKMNSDYGWILQSDDYQKVLGYSKKIYDFNIRSIDTIASILYYTNRDIDLYKREYQKVQTLAANVGGILKIFVTIGTFFVSFYNMSVFHSELTVHCDYEILQKYKEENFTYCNTPRSLDNKNKNEINQFIRDNKDNRINKQPSKVINKFSNSNIQNLNDNKYKIKLHDYTNSVNNVSSSYDNGPQLSNIIRFVSNTNNNELNLSSNNRFQSANNITSYNMIDKSLNLKIKNSDKVVQRIKNNSIPVSPKLLNYNSDVVLNKFDKEQLPSKMNNKNNISLLMKIEKNLNHKFETVNNYNNNLQTNNMNRKQANNEVVNNENSNKYFNYIMSNLEQYNILGINSIIKGNKNNSSNFDNINEKTKNYKSVFSPLSYLHNKLLSICFKKSKNKIELLNKLQKNIDNKLDVESLIVNKKLLSKLINIILDNNQITGIYAEMDFEKKRILEEFNQLL